MKAFNFPQYSPEWWAVRRGVPSASNFDKVMTPKTGKLSASAMPYICELIGQQYDPTYGQTEDYVSAAMKNGTMMEPTVRAWYELETGYTVDQVGFCLTDDGSLGCSPDGLINEDSEEGGLECKSPLPKTQIAYLLAGTLPDEYKCQVHGGMIVTGRNWWDFVSYCIGLPPLRVRVERDAFTEQLHAALIEFVQRYNEVKQRIAEMQPPEPVAAGEPEPNELMM